MRIQNVGSSLINDIENASVEKYYKPLNVGLLFFNDNPEKFFPYSRIEVVNIPDETGQGMEEHIFSGPVDEQLRNAMSYLKNNILVEKIFKVPDQAEAVRIKNYSYEALEEFVSNAVYHKSYQEHEPVTIRIEKERIEITSVPEPDKSISDDDIKNYQMRTRRYRNRRIGDFLKELNLVEGRNTGIPTAIKAIKENGSPLPTLLTDEDRTFFSVIVPIHPAFMNNGILPKVKSSGRRTRAEIMELILGILQEEEMSAAGIYKKIGYSGSPSKTFTECVEELIKDGMIVYSSDKRNASINVLRRVKERRHKGEHELTN